MDDYVIDGDLAFTNTRAALEFYREQYHKKKEWVGLTMQERDEINEKVYGAVPHYVAFHHAIEAKLKEKNAT